MIPWSLVDCANISKEHNWLSLQDSSSSVCTILTIMECNEFKPTNRNARPTIPDRRRQICDPVTDAVRFSDR